MTKPYKPAITREIYRKAMELRTSLLRRKRTVILYSDVEYDHLPKRPDAVDVDDGYGALRGRGIQRPLAGSGLAPRVQGSMPSRAAAAVEIKQRALRAREIDPETGKIVSNVLPSERSHHIRYSTKAIRRAVRMPDGSVQVWGRSGRLLKGKPAPKRRQPKTPTYEVVLVEVE